MQTHWRKSCHRILLLHSMIHCICTNKLHTYKNKNTFLSSKAPVARYAFVMHPGTHRQHTRVKKPKDPKKARRATRGWESRGEAGDVYRNNALCAETRPQHSLNQTQTGKTDSPLGTMACVAIRTSGWRNDIYIYIYV